MSATPRGQLVLLHALSLLVSERADRSAVSTLRPREGVVQVLINDHSWLMPALAGAMAAGQAATGRDPFQPVAEPSARRTDCPFIGGKCLRRQGQSNFA